LILDSFRLTGKNALVTGSSRGMGAAIAVALAQAGANVALHASRSVSADVIQRVAETGVRHVALAADLSHPDRVPRLMDQAIASLGSVDILINNAGITRRAPAVDYAIADWNDVIATNLTSVFRLCQCAARPMLERGFGKIVNIASLLSFQGGIIVPAYAAAKGARQRVGRSRRTGERHCARLHGHRSHRGSSERPNALPSNPRAHSCRPVGFNRGCRRSRCLPRLTRKRLHQRPRPGCGWRLARAIVPVSLQAL